jgi:hypothetical protein
VIHDGDARARRRRARQLPLAAGKKLEEVLVPEGKLEGALHHREGGIAARPGPAWSLERPPELFFGRVSHRIQQSILVAEVPIERSSSDADSRRDAPHGEAFRPLRRVNVGRCMCDLNEGHVQFAHAEHPTDAP